MVRLGKLIVNSRPPVEHRLRSRHALRRLVLLAGLALAGCTAESPMAPEENPPVIRMDPADGAVSVYPQTYIVAAVQDASSLDHGSARLTVRSRRGQLQVP